MPQRADVAQGPNVDIDVDQKFVVEVVGIDEQPSQFDNARPGEMSLTWKYRLFEQATGEAVIDLTSNTAYELWNFTSDKTYFNPKTGKKAKAREWTEALLGRELTDDEMNELIDLGFAESLQGKRGIADLEWYTTKQGNERLRIIRLRPFKKNSRQPQPEPEPVAAGAVSAAAGKKTEARKRLGLDDDDDE